MTSPISQHRAGESITHMQEIAGGRFLAHPVCGVYGEIACHQLSGERKCTADSTNSPWPPAASRVDNNAVVAPFCARLSYLSLLSVTSSVHSGPATSIATCRHQPQQQQDDGPALFPFRQLHLAPLTL